MIRRKIMSESGESLPSHDSELGVDALCAKVHRKLSAACDAPLPVASHRSAVNKMLCVRDLLLQGIDASQTSKMLLTCAGVVCMKRRVHRVDEETQVSLLKTTQTLLFSLLVLMDTSGKSPEPGEENCERDETLLVRAWKSSTLQDDLFGEHQAPPSSWTVLLRSDSAVCRAALCEARHTKGVMMQELESLSEVFFRSSANAMTSSMLHTHLDRTDEFLTLDTATLLADANREQSLSNIADAGESEAGQAALRDLILSFKLPACVLEVRKTLLLTREVNAKATKDYPFILNGAHEAAMRGTLWSWQEDGDCTHKLCALLSGLALLMAKGQTRKGAAFAGRVCLPFLDAPIAEPDKPRLVLLRESGTWVVFAPSGKPRAIYSGRGLDGFLDSVIIFLRFVR